MKKEVLNPFDLEKAKAGAKLRTVSGLDVRIICYDKKTSDVVKLIALVTDSKGIESLTAYTEQGHNVADSRLDIKLVEEVEASERWRDNATTVDGWYISDYSVVHELRERRYKIEDFNLFATKQQAYAALAAARISMIIANDERFGGEVKENEWKRVGLIIYSIILRYNGEVCIFEDTGFQTLLSFHTREQAELFLKENRDLVEQYFMLKEVE